MAEPTEAERLVALRMKQAAWFVLTTWTLLAIVTGSYAIVSLYRWTVDPSASPVGMLGQIGDVFGTLNALFTGLALIGLVYTSYKQSEQVDLQKAQILLQDQELKDQRDAEETAKKDREKALIREERYQFLAARLNARSAIAQANSFVPPLSSNPTPEDRELFKGKELIYRAAQLRVQILLEEAELGMDDNPWTSAIEREAIIRFFLRFLSWNKMGFTGGAVAPSIEDILGPETRNLVLNIAFHIEMILIEFNGAHEDATHDIHRVLDIIEFTIDDAYTGRNDINRSYEEKRLQARGGSEQDKVRLDREYLEAIKEDNARGVNNMIAAFERAESDLRELLPKP